MTIALHEGDCRDVIPRLVAEGVVVDAVVTDPPYHLTATAKRFSAANAAPAQYGKDGAMARLSGGFMGQQWDGGDIAFRPETWVAVATLLRPGGFLLAFGGTRTFHRLVCAIEDAGFVIQDAIGWLYGSGFPKRRDMLKPAMELVCVAYKPGGKRTLQVDECRIVGPVGNNWINTVGTGKGHGNTKGNGIYHDLGGEVMPPHPLGRWPANIIHDGSDEVMEAFAAFGDKSSPRANGNRNNPKHGLNGRHTSWEFGPLKETNDYRDTGTASRFFYSCKAGAQDRFGSRHPTVKPIELIRYLVKLTCPVGGTFLDCFAGSGTAGVAALAEGRNAILIEQDATYCADIRARLAHYEGEGRHSLAAKARNRQPHEQGGTLI